MAESADARTAHGQHPFQSISNGIILSNCTNSRTDGQYLYGDSIFSRKPETGKLYEKSFERRSVLSGIRISGYTSQTFQGEALKKRYEKALFYSGAAYILPSCFMEAQPHSGQMQVSKSHMALSSSAMPMPA